MRTDQWRRSLTVLAAAAVLAGCTSAEPQPEPTEPTSSPTETPTPTNSPSDPYAAPDEITPEYVDLVVNKIYERHGELLRELLSQDPDPSAVMPVEMRENFAEIFDGGELSEALEEGDRILQGQRANFFPASELQQLRFEAARIVASGEACIVAVGRWMNDEVADGGITIYAAAALEQRDSTATPHNPTPWLLADVALNRDSEGNANPDEVMINASLEDLTSAAIDTSCTTEDEL